MVTNNILKLRKICDGKILLLLCKKVNSALKQEFSSDYGIAANQPVTMRQGTTLRGALGPSNASRSDVLSFDIGFHRIGCCSVIRNPWTKSPVATK